MPRSMSTNRLTREASAGANGDGPRLSRGDVRIGSVIQFKVLHLGPGDVHVLAVDTAAGYWSESSDHHIGFEPAVSRVIGVWIEPLGHPPVVSRYWISAINLTERVLPVLFLAGIDGDLLGGQAIGPNPVDSRRAVRYRHVAIGHIDGLRQFLINDGRLTQYRIQRRLKLGLQSCELAAVPVNDGPATILSPLGSIASLAVLWRRAGLQLCLNRLDAIRCPIGCHRHRKRFASVLIEVLASLYDRVLRRVRRSSTPTLKSGNVASPSAQVRWPRWTASGVKDLADSPGFHRSISATDRPGTEGSFSRMRWACHFTRVS